MLNALLKLRDQACAHVALLLISSQDGCSSLLHQLPPMHEVPFPQYTDRELLAVLMKVRQSNGQMKLLWASYMPGQITGCVCVWCVLAVTRASWS